MSIGVGIIGLGRRRGWAAAAHLPALRALPDFEVRALSGSSPESARSSADVHGIATPCADHLELVERDDVDLVVVTVRVPEHHRLVGAAIDAGKAVLCEWPLGNGQAEADDLTARAAARELPAFVGLQARSAPAVRYVGELVNSGAIGEILSTSVLATGERWGATIDPAVTYLLDRANGATMLTIPLGHTLDAVCHTLGQLTTLTATTATRRRTVHRTDTGESVPMNAEDQIVVSGILGSGAVLSMHYRGGRCNGTNFLWEINGTGGDIVVRGSTGHLQYGRVEVLRSDPVTGTLVTDPVPARFTTTSVSPEAIGHTVAEAYALIASDLRNGTREAPSFADGARLHETLALVETAGNRLQAAN